MRFCRGCPNTLQLFSINASQATMPRCRESVREQITCRNLQATATDLVHANQVRFNFPFLSSPPFTAFNALDVEGDAEVAGHDDLRAAVGVHSHFIPCV